MKVIINRSGSDLLIPEIQKMIPFNGKQYEVPDQIFLKYRRFFELVPVELIEQSKIQAEQIKAQEQIINQLKIKTVFLDVLKVCEPSFKQMKPFDFLYSFQYEQNISEFVKRLKYSIKSIINQNVNVCVCNTSTKCIGKYLEDFDIKYIHSPKKVLNYCKSKTINIGVDNLVSSDYFFISDIDLIYPPTFIDYMSLFTFVKTPVRIIFNNNNIDSFNEKCKTFDDFRKSNIAFKKRVAPGNGLIHLDSFKKVKGFDERFIGYGSEDSEFNYRISKINKYFTIDMDEVNTYHNWHKQSENIFESMKLNEQMWRYIIWNGETNNISLIKAGETKFPPDLLERDWSIGRDFV